MSKGKCQILIHSCFFFPIIHLSSYPRKELFQSLSTLVFHFGSSSPSNPSGGGSGGSSSTMSGGSSSTSGGSSSTMSGGSGSGGTSSSSGSPSIPSFDPNKVNQIQASFLDPSKLQLGQSGGGGGGFDPDQLNSMSFSFFNPSALLSSGNSGPSGKSKLNEEIICIFRNTSTITICT